MLRQIFSRSLFGLDLKPATASNPASLEVIEYEAPPLSLAPARDFSALQQRVDPWADTQIDFV